VRKKWAGAEVVVLTMQQEGEPANARAQLRGIVARRCAVSTTRSRVASERPGWFLSARDTVPIDTFAARAMSRIVVAIVDRL